MGARARWAVVAAAVVVVAVCWWFFRPSEHSIELEPIAEPAGTARDAGSAAASPQKSTVIEAAAVVIAPASATLVDATWGSGPGQLGRNRPQEGNPEAPMALTLDRQGNAVVLDQVNGRLAKFGPDGKAAGTVPLTVQGAQDLAIAADGTTVVLDRLVDKTIAVMGPDGKLRGELPVEGKGIEEGGGVTGVFVDGQDVYVEREHGDLVKVGTLDGKADPARPEVPGRPTRDGLSFITAGFVDQTQGRLYVSSIAREGQLHRFTREYRLGVALFAIVLLDTDRSGIIYLGVLAELPTGKPDLSVAPAVLVTCLDPLDGRPIGQVKLPANTGADETFRELTVYDQGGVLYAHRTEEGVKLERYDCK